MEATFQALQAIHCNPGNRFTHTSLARTAGINDRTLRRVFKAFTGSTISTYIKRYRLQQASKAIAGGESLLTAEIAFGYNDLRYFKAQLCLHKNENCRIISSEIDLTRGRELLSRC